MKIYIAGKITGDKHYKKKFARAEKALRRLGHSVMNPAWIGASADFSWDDYMQVSAAMMDVCDAMLCLPDAEQSKGARIEYEKAYERGMVIFDSIRAVPDISGTCRRRKQLEAAFQKLLIGNRHTVG